MNTNKLEEFNLSEKYGLESILPRDEFLSKMNLLQNGLTIDFANSLLQKNGPNELKSAKKKNGITIFLKVFLALLILFF